MNKRDISIIKDLERFRVMSRNDIVDLHFPYLKNPVTCANTVLKRLVRDKQIKVSRSFNPYVYFPYDSTMKGNSTKIPHFLKLIDVYKQLKSHKPKQFIIEPKFTKGLAEPDILCKMKDTPFFIELQRNQYSEKVMDNKIKRYEALKFSPEFTNKKFPFIILITDVRYGINSDVLTIFQVRSIREFLDNAKRPKKQSGIIFRVGSSIKKA